MKTGVIVRKELVVGPGSIPHSTSYLLYDLGQVTQSQFHL